MIMAQNGKRKQLNPNQNAKQNCHNTFHQVAKPSTELDEFDLLFEQDDHHGEKLDGFPSKRSFHKLKIVDEQNKKLGKNEETARTGGPIRTRHFINTNKCGSIQLNRGFERDILRRDKKQSLFVEGQDPKSKQILDRKYGTIKRWHTKSLSKTKDTEDVRESKKPLQREIVMKAEKESIERDLTWKSRWSAGLKAFQIATTSKQTNPNPLDADDDEYHKRLSESQKLERINHSKEYLRYINEKSCHIKRKMIIENIKNQARKTYPKNEVMRMENGKSPKSKGTDNILPFLAKFVASGVDSLEL